MLDLTSPIYTLGSSLTTTCFVSLNWGPMACGAGFYTSCMDGCMMFCLDSWTTFIGWLANGLSASISCDACSMRLLVPPVIMLDLVGTLGLASMLCWDTLTSNCLFWTGELERGASSWVPCDFVGSSFCGVMCICGPEATITVYGLDGCSLSWTFADSLNLDWDRLTWAGGS